MPSVSDAMDDQIVEIRKCKTDEEIDILVCTNEATLLAIRATHKHMYMGMKESKAWDLVVHALAAVGLQHASCLTLFGENAALPHGLGTDRTLHKQPPSIYSSCAHAHARVHVRRGHTTTMLSVM
ncbi:hypothetical protein EYR36_002123 [Pleurotus pulmonarius]|nr:hypothetical protein EYR36_002123 [Pleurotus pulmonarius]KAF4588144.1 hypothetical protein EYR38_010109 [Pleurotus pulmonarius]